MRSIVTRGAAAAAVALLSCLSLWPTASFAASTGDVKASVESWYQVSPTEIGTEDPTCALPVGCVPQPSAPVQPYAQDTLHVGLAAGRDTARVFLALDTSALPTGAVISGGTLTLPVLPDQDSGTVRPESAKLAACSVLEPVKKARGGPAEEQPQFSCSTAAKATYKGGKNPAVTVDLAPLAATLVSGGIAIVPAKAARDAGDTWHLAFPAREHAAKDRIEATVLFDKPQVLDPVVTPTPGQDTTVPSGSDPVAGGFDEPAASAPEPVNPVSGAAPDLAGPAAPAPVAAGPGGGDAPLVAGPPAPGTAPVAAVYYYPGAWLAPLVLALVAGVLARCLAGEIELPAAAPAGGPGQRESTLTERLQEAFWPSHRSSGPPGT
jgi:hypothetical protein